MLDRIEFLIAEAFISLRRNTWMTFSAVTTSAMALLLLGGLGLAYRGIMGFASSLPNKLEMRVMLQSELPQEQVTAIGLQIQAIPEVASVELIPSELGWQRMKEAFPDVTEGMDNVLPDAYRIKIRKVGDADLVASKVGQLQGQDGVEYMRQEYNLIDESVRLIRLVGAVLGGMMFVTSGVLIYNAIRLAIMARAREIRIMELVGASSTTIWVPLLIEGVIHGALGGALASVVLWPTYDLVLSMGSKLAFMTENPAPFPAAQVFGVLIVVGALYGLICSAIAVRVPRKV